MSWNTSTSGAWVCSACGSIATRPGRACLSCGSTQDPQKGRDRERDEQTLAAVKQVEDQAAAGDERAELAWAVICEQAGWSS